MEKIYVLNEPQLKELAKLLLEDYRREIVAEIHGTPQRRIFGVQTGMSGTRNQRKNFPTLP